MGISEQQRRAMAELYRSGYTSYEIGHAFDREPSVVRDHLRAEGVSLRRRGSRPRPDVSTSEIVRLIDEVGLSYTRTARLVGLSRTATRNRYLRHHYGYGWRYSPPEVQGTVPGGPGVGAR
ncbi:DNA-directed RNA polymerase specialized sigma24 family protein [Nocardiopsis mwathae]|uniref:DNA-directed RNA polymerase specialized sigma24 family protein n=1 Tax=Nocardiopsis mwathae TaxID=1472723 RepID=A0A7W9YHB2_9ACTN|nr:hypothetical protein [Nocardiopsis mwathae]MBB6172149.1 DNA-directed RNA polymerase specialized sigma24 family protein [Nocardiopsis mwathae]